MAIVFIVEDGSRVDNANSYVTVEEFKQYCENRGLDYTGLTDAKIQPLLIQATQDIDKFPWAGVAYSLTQSLNWPRVYMVNARGRSLNVNEIPTELKDSVCELAKVIYTRGSDIYNNPDAGNIRQKTIGPVTTSYFTPTDKRDYMKKPYELLAPFLSKIEALRC